jgi:DNA-binding transcriptional LysR family regulator
MQVAQSDLRSLAVFRAVVEHGSFLGAQIALGLSQSAVSFHIKALEERLGFRLCRRGRAGFELTDRGAAVYEKSKALYLALNAFESGVGLLKHDITGTLRLGLVDNTITDEDLPIARVIAEISRKAPQAVIRIVIDTPEALAAEIGTGGIDIAILPEVQAFPGIRFSPFKDERHSLYCAAGHPLWTVPTEALTPAGIEAHAFVVRPYANRRELRHFPNAIVRATASNIEAQAMFVLSGYFVGYLPDHYAATWVRQGRFRALLPEAAGLSSPFVIATRQAERAPAVLDLFIRELTAAASERLHRARGTNPS